MNLIQCRKDCKVLDQLLDNYEEDCGGGDNDQQPFLLSLHVLFGRDRFRADWDDQADGENNLQCVPVAGDCLSKFQVVNHYIVRVWESWLWKWQEHLNKPPLIRTNLLHFPLWPAHKFWTHPSRLWLTTGVVLWTCAGSVGAGEGGQTGKQVDYREQVEKEGGPGARTWNSQVAGGQQGGEVFTWVSTLKHLEVDHIRQLVDKNLHREQIRTIS